MMRIYFGKRDVMSCELGDVFGCYPGEYLVQLDGNYAPESADTVEDMMEHVNYFVSLYPDAELIEL